MLSRKLTRFAKTYLLFAGSQNGKKPKRSIFRTLFCCCVSGESDSGGSANGVCVSEDVSPYTHLQPPTGPQRHLLPAVSHRDMHKKCMVIDLDETLVHSSFKVRVQGYHLIDILFFSLNHVFIYWFMNYLFDIYDYVFISYLLMNLFFIIICTICSFIHFFPW